MIPFTVAHEVQQSSGQMPWPATALLLAGWLVVLGVAVWALRGRRS